MNKAIKAWSVFRLHDCGNVAAFFSLSALPVLLTGAIAVEYSNLNRAHAELQVLIDAAALAAAGAYADGNNDYQEVAEKYVDNNMKEGSLAGLEIDPTATANGDASTMSVESSANIPTMMGTLFGRSATTIQVKSTVTVPVLSNYDKGEIVLVMDYSGSMTETVNGNKKYETMRDNTVSLVNDLTQEGTNTDVKFGLVPFSDMVRVTMPRNFFSGQTASTNWTRCISDRKYPYNLESTTPTTSTSSNDTKFIDEGSCSSSYGGGNLIVRELTTDHAGTISQITNMQPYNLTHIALGMEWAFHVLSPNDPYSTGTSFGTSDVLKAVVLLTDGRQTSSGWGPGNKIWDRSPEQAESNLEAICTNLKANGVRVITVSFDLDDTMEDDTEQRLKNCSGDVNEPDGTYYFNTDTNDELAAAFSAIEDQLSGNMYLSE